VHVRIVGKITNTNRVADLHAVVERRRDVVLSADDLARGSPVFDVEQVPSRTAASFDVLSQYARRSDLPVGVQALARAQIRNPHDQRDPGCAEEDRHPGPLG
jgi:hypothetical protein